MRISAFLENISQIAQKSEQSMMEVLKELKAEGLESVYTEYSRVMKEREQEMIELLNMCGLKLEGLWDTIPIHEMSETEVKEEYMGLVDCAARNGAKHVLITPGGFHKSVDPKKITREEVLEREEDIQYIMKQVNHAVIYGRNKGVDITLEDYDIFTSPVVFPDVLRRFFEEIPDLKCSFDTGNFISCDYDVMKEFPYYKDRIVAIHLKDRIENDNQGGREKTPYITESGRKYYPIAVGYGDMHIPEIVKEMKNENYDGAGIIELFGADDMKNQMLKSIHWIKENT
jgi:sugar phosphate isomerase/epimerase